MLRKLALYIPLSIFALITLVPFVYMACSAIKPRSVFFSSPFLPVDGLFAIDRATGDLTVVDITHLPPPPEDEVQDKAVLYPLTVALYVGNDEVASRNVTVVYGDPGNVGGQRADFVIPLGAEVNTRLGRVELALPHADAEGSSATEAAGTSGGDSGGTPAFDTVSYRITEGNLHGPLHTAWGMLTATNFDNLFRGVPLADGLGGIRRDARGNVIRESTGVWRAIVNSFFYASVSSVLATLGAAMGGYALSKFRFKGRDTIDNLVLAALVIPGALLIAPGYQLLYWFGMLDSYVGLILPGIAPAFGVYLFRQAMTSSLPDEMMEAARIDGCGEVKMFFLMALPMVRPMAGAFLLITYLAAWNNFIGPQIILQTPEKYPLAVWIAQLSGIYGIDYGLIMAGTLVAIAPVLVLFLLLQKEFIAGLTAGAVKG